MPETSAPPLAWIPNAITFSRFGFALALLAGAGWLATGAVEPLAAPPAFGLWMAGCYVIGAFSDLLDGWAARALRAESEFGARLDPVADKALAFCAMILALAMSGFSPAIAAAAILIALRDFWVDHLRAKQPAHSGLKVTSLAKIKTALLFLALGFLLSGLQPWPQILGALTGGAWTYPAGGLLPGLTLLWASVALALLTGWRYVRAAQLNGGA